MNKLKARAKAFVTESNVEKKKLTAAVKALQIQLKEKIEAESALGKRVADLSAKIAELELSSTNNNNNVIFLIYF